METVAVIGGTGALGFGLSTRLLASGASVVIGSRAPERAEEAAKRLGEGARGLVNEEAARAAELVVVCVPFKSQADTYKTLRGALSTGQVVVDATVPLAVAVSGKPTRLLGVPQGSAAEQADELTPQDVDVVAAFHSVSATNLANLGHMLDEDVLLCGDNAQAKSRVAEMVGTVDGLRPVDAGPLEQARQIEALTPLLISVNRQNNTHAGIKLSGINKPNW